LRWEKGKRKEGSHAQQIRGSLSTKKKKRKRESKLRGGKKKESSREKRGKRKKGFHSTCSATEAVTLEKGRKRVQTSRPHGEAKEIAEGSERPSQPVAMPKPGIPQKKEKGGGGASGAGMAVYPREKKRKKDKGRGKDNYPKGREKREKKFSEFPRGKTNPLGEKKKSP